MQSGVQTQGWHIEKWGALGWIETVLKLVAIGAGMVAFVRSLSADGFVLANNSHLAAVIVLVLLVVASIVQVTIRFQQRETVSMIFAILNLLGHLGLLFALLRLPDHRTLPLIFGVFYILGQLTKLQFLRTSGYTEGGATTRMMLGITTILTAIYVLFAVFMVL